MKDWAPVILTDDEQKLVDQFLDHPLSKKLLAENIGEVVTVEVGTDQNHPECRVLRVWGQEKSMFWDLNDLLRDLRQGRPQ